MEGLGFFVSLCILRHRLLKKKKRTKVLSQYFSRNAAL